MWALFRRTPPKHQRRILSLGSLLALSATVAMAVHFSSITDRLTRSDTGSASSRLDMMVDAVQVIAHNYLTGVGLNNYSTVVWHYDVTGIHRAWGVTAVVHNLFLLIAAETGVVSLCVFSFMLFRILRKAGRAMEDCEVSAETVFMAGLRLGIVCFLIQSTMDAGYCAYPGLQRTFWLFMGLVTGYAEVYQQRQRCRAAASVAQSLEAR